VRTNIRMIKIIDNLTKRKNMKFRNKNKSITLYGLVFLLIMGMNSCGSDVGVADSGNTVLSGSYASMLNIGSKLYILGETNLRVLDVANPLIPIHVTTVNVDADVESLFFNSGNLFVGSPQGMYIYTLDGSGIPQLASITPYEQFAEILPCDPIVANDTLAFSTLSTSFDQTGNCWRPESLNELHVYDIKDVSAPKNLARVEMEEPKGLGLADDHLFVCERYNGIKAFNISSPENPELVYSSNPFEAVDLIPANGTLLVVGVDTIHQFDYTDIDNIVKISTIATIN